MRNRPQTWFQSPPFRRRTRIDRRSFSFSFPVFESLRDDLLNARIGAQFYFESGGDIHGWINAAVTGMSKSGKAQPPTLRNTSLCFALRADGFAVVQIRSRRI
jgi:hypothetical protein